MTLLDRARRLALRLIGRREYRFAHEEGNQAEQLRMTQTSIGLMAAAARQGDDDSRRQAAQTEMTLRDRKKEIIKKRRKQGLTEAERLELESINRGLAELIAAEAATDEPPVLVRREAGWTPPRFLSALGGIQLWQALAVGWAVTFGLLGVQTARVANAKHDLREMADTARANAETAHRWQERAEEYREGLVDAANVARQAADALESERERQARAAARERRRNREVANVLARSPDAPEWRLRDASGQTEGDGTTP